MRSVRAMPAEHQPELTRQHLIFDSAEKNLRWGASPICRNFVASFVASFVGVPNVFDKALNKARDKERPVGRLPYSVSQNRGVFSGINI